MFWGRVQKGLLAQKASPFLSQHPRSVYLKKRGETFSWKKADIEKYVLLVLADNVSCPPEKVTMYASTQWDLLMDHREQYLSMLNY